MLGHTCIDRRIRSRGFGQQGFERAVIGEFFGRNGGGKLTSKSRHALNDKDFRSLLGRELLMNVSGKVADPLGWE
jgi:hypothetical protein